MKYKPAEIIRVPLGQTKESFRRVKIRNVKRALEMYRQLCDDIEYFDKDFQIDIFEVEMKLMQVLEKLKE